MAPISERRALQIAVLVFCLIPVIAGLAGVLLGPAMMDDGVVTLRLDSQFRYLSGTLLGIGLAFWSLVPRIRDQGPAFRLLTAIVFVGGLGRLLGMIEHGIPNPIMLGALRLPSLRVCKINLDTRLDADFENRESSASEVKIFERR